MCSSAWLILETHYVFWNKCIITSSSDLMPSMYQNITWTKPDSMSYKLILAIVIKIKIGNKPLILK